MWSSSDRWDLSRSHRPIGRVELWSRSQLVSSSVPFADGSVTEKWVTGVRSTLTLTVDPSPQWLAWLGLPALELLPYAGVSWGETAEEMPLGVFPLLFPGVDAPLKTITLNCQDHWQYVASAKFMYPIMSYPGLIRDVAAKLVAELGIGADRIHPVTMDRVGLPAITASSAAVMASVLWDKSRHETVVQLVDSIGAEAFIDRYGRPTVRDRLPQTGADLVDGVGGTVASVGATVDWTDVVNSIAVTSTKNDVTFDPAVAAITDPLHPASVENVGPRFDLWSSPLITDRTQALLAAQTQLLKRSAPARAWSVQCVPDPRRMPGDQFTLTTKVHGANQVVVQEVTHPLGEGKQTIKLGAA